MKYVNVNEVLNILHKYGEYVFVTEMKRYYEMMDEISNLKGLNQKTEHWIKHSQEYAPDKFQTFYECSECSEVSWLSNYCPNCGAKMKGE